MTRIKQVKLNLPGSIAGAVELDQGAVTVFVGPNNSGKSLVLREIDQACRSRRFNHQGRILHSLTFNPLTPAEAEKALNDLELKSAVGPPGLSRFGRGSTSEHISKQSMQQGLHDPSQIADYYLKFYTLFLGGANRTTLLNTQPAGDLSANVPSNCLQSLFLDSEKCSAVRKLLYESFGNYLVVDPSNLGHLRVGFSTKQPVSDVEERGLNAQAIAYYRQLTPIEQMSDGVKAFAGLVVEVLAGDPEIILIDEAEAFLHPPLAAKLGQELCSLAQRSDKNIFASTHSANFVMGCIQSGAPVNIVRLSYKAGRAKTRILNNSRLTQLMLNPLLRSVGVLSALFYEAVVITESDTDRAFYQEVNERLVRENKGRGIHSCLFLNAQNKQTVKSIIRPLRDLGIPAVAIVDIDVLKDGGGVWTAFVEEGGCVPQIDREAMNHSRLALLRKLEESGKNMKTQGGLELLIGSHKEAAHNLFDSLARYGLFVLRRGELENWLPDLGVQGHGPKWLIPIFEKMGEDPNSSDYMNAGVDDVWAFMEEVKTWLVSSDQKGMPA